MGRQDPSLYSARIQGLPVRVTSAARTDVGHRRDHNEDACLARPHAALWAVADGVGGLARGDYAARQIVDGLDRLRLAQDGATALLQVGRALSDVNEHLLAVAERNGGARLASTVVALLIRQQRWHCLWAGDSRCYLLRGGRLKRVSRDHSRVQEMVEAGMITPEQADIHPENNVITRAIGAVERLELEQATESLMDGDRFLLCSDGLTRHLPDRELQSLMQVQRGAALVDTLMDVALSRGGADNITIVTAEIEQA